MYSKRCYAALGALSVAVLLSLTTYAADVTTGADVLEAVEQAIGAESNLGIAKVSFLAVGTEITDDLFDEALVLFAAYGGRNLTTQSGVCVVYFVGDDNLSRSYIKTGMQWDIARIDHTVFSGFRDIIDLFVIAQFPLMDKYGNSSLKPVSIQYMHHSTAAKVNWEVAVSALPRIATEAADFFTWLNDF